MANEKGKIYADARFKPKSDTLKNWQTKNPVLLSGEPGVVIGLKEAGDGLVNETERIKFGDGVTPWNDLPWWKGPKGDTGERGEKGDTGERGEQGTQGEQGVSVIGTEINSNGNLVISFSNGQQNELGNVIGAKGDKGDAGAVKLLAVNELPMENIQEDAIYLLPTDNSQENNTFHEYVYIDGVWEEIGAVSVEVNLDEYVKNTDFGTSFKAGVVKPSNAFVCDTDGTLYITEPTRAVMSAKQTRYALKCSNIDYAVKVGLTTNTETLTDEEKTAACEWLGIADFIVEQGTDGIWTYEKWSSGKAVCYGMTSEKYITCDRTSNGVYRAGVSETFPTGLFVERPKSINLEILATIGVCFSHTINTISKDDIDWYVSANSTSEGSYDMTFVLEAKGRWK